MVFPSIKRLVIRTVMLGNILLKWFQQHYNLSRGLVKKLGLQVGLVSLLLFIASGNLLASNQSEPNQLIEDATPASISTLTLTDGAAIEIASADADFEQLFINDVEDSDNPNPEDGYTSEDDVISAPTIKPIRKEIVHYAVRDGDTVSSIAQEFEISTSTVLWANNLTATTVIRPGQDLTILPISGITYTVKTKDTLQKIADATHSDIDAIRSTNSVADTSLVAGATLIIPNGRPASIPRIAIRNTSPKQTAGRSRVDQRTIPNLDVSRIAGLVWPTTLRRINQFFGRRHYGVDIQGRMGNPIYAAADGVVAIAGWNRGGYGQQVVLEHDKSMITRYAHMTKILVSPGENIEKGQVIGLVGSTGRSTGPHLHFEILVRGARMNPMKYF